MLDSLREQWVILISTPLYLFIIGLEILLSHLQHRKLYTLKDTFANIYLMLLNAGMDLLFRSVYVSFWLMLSKHAFLQIENLWIYWISLIILEDFLYY